MLIHVINPNSTATMTDSIARTARAAARPGTRLLVQNPGGTPVSIEGASDEARAVPPMLDAIAAADALGAAAHVIACFDDPGLHAAREVANAPVIGLCQAGVQVAMTLATRFSIVTTLPRSVPIIEDLVDRYGASRHCRRVRSVDCAVLALETDRSDTMRRMGDEIARAKSEDGAEAILLGCAGMASLAPDLARLHGLPVIDAVGIAVRLAEALAVIGTSKIGSYAPPLCKAEPAEPHRSLSDL